MGGCRAWLAAAFALVAGSAAAQQSLRDCPDCPEMVTIPAGSFTMGVPPGEEKREGYSGWVGGDAQPQRRVTLEYSFSLGRYEVTRAQFEAFVQATGHVTGPSCWTAGMNGQSGDVLVRNWRDPGFTQTPNDPVVCVNWDDAQAYVAWLKRTTGKHYRLPSEAEWEYAARAGSQTARYWGDGRDGACQYANVADLTAASRRNWEKDPKRTFLCTDGYAYTAPVGQFRPNAFGLYDMLGNVWEWTGDCWNQNYNGAPTNGGAWVQGDCSIRVMRGGAWYYPPETLRAGNRFRGAAGDRGIAYGFRVARTD